LHQGFTGRGWVVDAVEDWLRDPGGAPAFLLTGNPGAGKSAVMAHLARQLPQVAVLQFCRAENSQMLRADAFVRSVAAQLTTQLPSNAEALQDQMHSIPVARRRLFNHITMEVRSTALPGQAWDRIP
jgi:dephospho-CoA kinase